MSYIKIPSVMVEFALGIKLCPLEGCNVKATARLANRERLKQQVPQDTTVLIRNPLSRQ